MPTVPLRACHLRTESATYDHLIMNVFFVFELTCVCVYVGGGGGKEGCPTIYVSADFNH